MKRQMVAVSELVEVDSLLALLGEVPTAAELRECMREGLPVRGAIAGGKHPAPAVVGIRR